MSDRIYESRLKNAKRNVFSGLIKTIIVIVLNFSIRTAVLYILGAEYQGLSGLFTSILQVLNLSDLGFSSAVTFILYKAIAEENTEAICAIIFFLKKAYRSIGVIILCIGMIILPFLPNLISSEYPDNINIYILYLIYLLNAVISYLLFAYKSTLLTAMQRDDIVSNVYSITTFVSKGLQLLFLILFRNYYIYVLVLPIGSLFNNILLQILSCRIFPEIVPKGTISLKTKKLLFKQIQAVFISRISDIARNSFDNIVLSMFMGLVTVAIYDNYYYIYSAIYGFMGIIIHAISASVGNSLVKESIEKNYSDCKKFTFIFMWIVGWCTICMACLYQPFMIIWMRGNMSMLLTIPNMLLFCLYFYTISMVYTKGVYLEAKGLFRECRNWYILEALGNLLLNIILGSIFGVAGILIATIVTIVAFNFIGGTNVLFKQYFQRKPKEFYMKHLFYFFITVINCVITYAVCIKISYTGVASFAIKVIICFVLPNIFYLLIYFKASDFKDALEMMIKFIQR